jgi:hypothetical protein
VILTGVLWLPKTKIKKVHPMDDGLPDSNWIGFGDAEQWLASGQAYSLRPNWIDEDRLALLPLVETVQREMKTAAEAHRAATGRPSDALQYPFPPSDVDGKPVDIVAILEAHRGDWTPSTPALFEAAKAAANAYAEKEQMRQTAHDQLVNGWRTGKLPWSGRRSEDPHAAFETIDPRLALGAVVVEICRGAEGGHDMYLHPAETNSGRPGMSTRPVYRAISMERADLLRFRSELTGDADTPDKTGVAGRPTSMDLIKAEAQRRIDLGEIPKFLTEFTRELVEWFRSTPQARRGAPVPKPRSLENPLRPLWLGRAVKKA